MCTFQDEHTIIVCDLALGKVRKELTAAFGAAIRFTPTEGHGTFIEAEPGVSTEQFIDLARAAITAAQKAEPLELSTEP